MSVFKYVLHCNIIIVYFIFGWNRFMCLQQVKKRCYRLQTRSARSSPPLQNVSTFLFIFQSFVYAIHLLYLKNYELTFPMRVEFSNLQVYWYFYIMGWSKTWPAHSLSPPPPPTKCFDLSIYLSVFGFMLLFHCIWTWMNDLFQRENQVFKPTIYWYFHIMGWGKTGPGQFPPSTPFQNVLTFQFISQLFGSC